MLRVHLSYDKSTQTLTGIIADANAGCLLATVMMAYDVYGSQKTRWSDIMVTGKEGCSPHLATIQSSATKIVSGAILRYLADRSSTDNNLSALLQGLKHPAELLMALGSFAVIYEVESADTLINITQQFSALQVAPDQQVC